MVHNNCASVFQNSTFLLKRQATLRSLVSALNSDDRASATVSNP